MEMLRNLRFIVGKAYAKATAFKWGWLLAKGCLIARDLKSLSIISNCPLSAGLFYFLSKIRDHSCAWNTLEAGSPYGFLTGIFYTLLVTPAYFCSVTNTSIRVLWEGGSHWDQVQITNLTVVNKQCQQTDQNHPETCLGFMVTLFSIYVMPWLDVSTIQIHFLLK